MNLEPNNKSLSFAEFLDAAIRDKAEAKPFPYTLEVCRCRYCSFCQNGKCALKRCCCMNERVKARSCTFSSLSLIFNGFRDLVHTNRSNDNDYATNGKNDLSKHRIHQRIIPIPIETVQKRNVTDNHHGERNAP